MFKTHLTIRAASILLFASLLILPTALQCEKKPRQVSLRPSSTDTGTTHIQTSKLKIAVGAIISPPQTLAYYEDMFNYIGEQLGSGIEIIQRQTYAEVNFLIREGRIDLAFVCSRPYVAGYRDFGMDILCVPVSQGKKEYCSYFIVHKDSPIQNLGQLRGGVFAFTDPQSNSGTLIPEYVLAKMGETPRSFFRSVIFTYSHDNSIRSVAERFVDGAAVDNLIWEYLNLREPEFTSKTRIVFRSEPCAIPPVVVSPDLAPDRRILLEKSFLSMHTTPEGKRILDRLLIDRFDTIADSAYNSIRRMEDFMRVFHDKK